MLHSEPNQKQNKMSPPKFTYSGRICRFAQFFVIYIEMSYHCKVSVISIMMQVNVSKPSLLSSFVMFLIVFSMCLLYSKMILLESVCQSLDKKEQLQVSLQVLGGKYE